MKFKTLTVLLLSLFLGLSVSAQDEAESKKDQKKDKWKYVGSTVYDARQSINVDSYFNENKVERTDQTVKFQIKEQPDKPIPFFKSVFAKLYEFNPDKYADFTHLITHFEGNCREKTLRVTHQEVWGTKNEAEPIITFTVEREFEPVRNGSSKEKDLLKACRTK